MLKVDKFILLVIFNAMTTNLKRFVVQYLVAIFLPMRFETIPQ